MRRITSAAVSCCLACGALSTADVAAQQHEWRSIEGTSRIDGTRQVVLFVEASEEAIDESKQARPMLFMRCSENVTTLFFDVSPFHVSGSVPVSWRVDGQNSISGAWWASANNGGVGPWRGGQAIRFIKSLVDRKILRFRFTPHEGRPIETAFNIAGLNTSLGPLRATCKW